MSRLRRFGLLVVALLVGAATQVLGGSPVGAVNAQHDRVVGAVPGTNSPQVIDGRVYAITQVGNTVLVGGSFTQVQPYNRSTTYNLPYVVAFDATTGVVNTAFTPQLDGTVETLLPRADGRHRLRRRQLQHHRGSHREGPGAAQPWPTAPGGRLRRDRR